MSCAFGIGWEVISFAKIYWMIIKHKHILLFSAKALIVWLSTEEVESDTNSAKNTSSADREKLGRTKDTKTSLFCKDARFAMITE